MLFILSFYSGFVLNVDLLVPADFRKCPPHCHMWPGRARVSVIIVLLGEAQLLMNTDGLQQNIFFFKLY